eukprot:6191534-Pleurochrysis_carterae.AAC.2
MRWSIPESVVWRASAGVLSVRDVTASAACAPQAAQDNVDAEQLSQGIHVRWQLLRQPDKCCVAWGKDCQRGLARVDVARGQRLMSSPRVEASNEKSDRGCTALKEEAASLSFDCKTRKAGTTSESFPELSESRGSEMFVMKGSMASTGNFLNARKVEAENRPPSRLLQREAR